MQVAPLRERKEDIPLLAQHFIQNSARELGCAKPRLTRAGAVRLQGYDWPGNIRELRNVIERAVILARGGALEFDVPAGETPPARFSDPKGEGESPKQAFLTEVEMHQRERANLLIVLEKTRWKIKGPDGAADLLGLKPTTLISRLKKLGLQRPG